MRYVNSVERLAREEGLTQGIQEGMQEGMHQGRRAGKGQLIGRQLQVRFGELPAWARARLDESIEEQLDAWSDRLVTAPSIEAVFDSAGH